MPAGRHINTLKVSHLKSFKNGKHQKIFLDVLDNAKKPLMPSQRSPQVLLWVIPLLQALENPGQHHTFHDQRTRKHASTSSSGIRKPRTGARDDGMSTPAPAPFSLLPQDLADPATYRGDDGSHAEGLLEDKSPPFFCRGGDDVSVNMAGFL